MSCVCVVCTYRDDGDDKAHARLENMSTAELGGDDPVISKGATSGQKKGKKKKTFDDM